MEVILIQDVNEIGKAGNIVKVKDGFARNFLFPKKLALVADSVNIKKLEREKQKKVQGLEKVKKEAELIKEKLNAFSLTIPALTQEEDKEKLYGSITAQDLADALKEEGFQVDKNSIILEQPIKSLGIFEVSIKLHPEVQAMIKVWVVKK